MSQDSNTSSPSRRPTGSRAVFFLLSLVLVLPLVATNLSARHQDGDEDSLYKHLAVFTEVVGLVKQAYVEPADETKLVKGALDGATDALDPFSFYVPEEAMDTWVAARSVGPKLSGLMLLRERGFIYVAGVVQGSPADQAGLRVGDMVAEIDGENTSLTALWQAQAALARKAGTEVELKIFRQGEIVAVDLKLQSFESLPVELSEAKGTPVLRIFEIQPGTAAEVGLALAEVTKKNETHLLLDLRGVAGGDAAEAFKIAGLFVDGELGTLRDREESLVSFLGQVPRWQGKVVLLVNRGTLGPAEVLATVLRQKADAELVGERTFGHAGRQKGVALDVGGELWLTDAFYAGPDGEPLRESLQPDLYVSDRGRYDDKAEDGPEAEGGPEAEEGAEAEGRVDPSIGNDAVLERGLSRLLAEESEEESAEQKAA